MVPAVSPPVTTTIIALDIGGMVDNDFSVLLNELSDLGWLTVDSSGAAAALTLDSPADIESVLRSFAGVLSAAKSSPRVLIHFGLAIKTNSGDGAIVFQGSGVRSTVNFLKRSTLSTGTFATADFVRYATGAKVAGVTFLAADKEGFHPVQFDDVKPGVILHPSGEMHSADPELVAFIKSRLARDLGPFAAALVDNASHSTRTAKELAAAVGHEIVDAKVRQRFDADVFNYLKSRNIS